MKLSDPYLDVNNRSVDVKNRKAFGLRSNYVQITFDYVRLAQKLRNICVNKLDILGPSRESSRKHQNLALVNQNHPKLMHDGWIGSVALCPASCPQFELWFDP